MFEARVEREAFDVGREHARMQALGSHVGAISSFVGQVRDAPLDLEHYPGMAERQMLAILEEARKRWKLAGGIIVHRFGRLDVGDPIVLVLTASSHRADSLESTAFLIDWLKTRAPFWKKEGDGWVEARAADDAAAERWL